MPSRASKGRDFFANARRVVEQAISPMALSDQSFFANPSIGDLMAANNVQPLNDLSVLAGGIPPDEDVDEMLRVIYDARK